MKEIFFSDMKANVLENPDLSEVVFKDGDGNPLEGVHISTTLEKEYSIYKLNFERGILSDYEDGRTYPAVEGPGLMEFRKNGILTNPESPDEIPARICEGFNKREYWENGKLIKVSEKSYDKNDNAVWS